MEALAKRSTSRSFDPKRDLSEQQLSSLLWAAFGVNRADGKRTAPSARNWQEVDLYVLLGSGAYLYDAKNHGLRQVASDDIRAFGGTQPFVTDAPVTLIYVADLGKMQGGDEARKNTANIDTGYISQNVYLYCASEGLATGARGSLRREALAERLGLSDKQYVVLAQSVGWPNP